MTDGLRSGFVGLGAMGSGMARNLAEKGRQPLAVYDKLEARCQAARDWGAVICATPAKVAERSDVVFTMLPDDASVLDVVFGESGIAAGTHQDLVLVDFSTIDPGTLVGIADRLKGRCKGIIGGAATLGTIAAEEGRLSVFVDDYDGLLEPVRPQIECFAQQIMPSGGLGSAKTMKLLNNLLVAVNVTATAEALILGEKAGIPAEVSIPILLKGSGASYALKHHFEGAYLDGALVPGRFPVNYMLKDLRICQKLAERSNHSMLFGSQALSTYRGARALGYGEHYYPIVVEWMKHISAHSAGGNPTAADES